MLWFLQLMDDALGQLQERVVELQLLRLQVHEVHAPVNERPGNDPIGILAFGKGYGKTIRDGPYFMFYA